MALEERLLSRVRQNEIFECVQQLGLNPSEFKWDKAVPKGSSGYLASRLTHLPTGLYFTFGGKGEGRFWTEWWPPDNSGRSQDLLDSWVVQKNVAFRWLADVKQESEAPDLWGAAVADRTLASVGATDSANTPFAPDELKQIHAKLDEISEYIRATHTHDDAANEQVTKRFFYLKSAATRLGRIDWLSILVGQMVSMASNGIFNAAALSDVMHFAGTAFHTMIKLLGS